jgi:GNAT superfamily N-acetyltransferase
MTSLVVRSRAYSDELKLAASVIEHATWSPLAFLNYTKPHRELYNQLLEDFPEFQICLVDVDSEYPVAAATCVPIPKVDVDDLPAEGWDWLVETAAANRAGCPQLLGALAISVPVIHRRKGYARMMIRAMRELAERQGLAGLVAPVRPSAKSEHPYVPIGEYICWKDQDGLVFDPWLRTHLAEGGRLVGPCEKSMVVEEHIAFWETWAGRRIERSGEYVLEGALSPILIDLEAETGRYEEPNIWIAYSLT